VRGSIASKTDAADVSSTRAPGVLRSRLTDAAKLTHMFSPNSIA
jgi:hypothetical protein